MADEPGNYQPLNKSLDFKVHAADGYITQPLSLYGGDAAIQINFWTYTAHPDAENNKLRYEHPQHYRLELSHTLETAVRLNPTVAYFLARTLLDHLQKLPESTRARYQLPSIPAIPPFEEHPS